jgi:hypothetical protein
MAGREIAHRSPFRIVSRETIAAMGLLSSGNGTALPQKGLRTRAGFQVLWESYWLRVRRFESALVIIGQ